MGKAGEVVGRRTPRNTPTKHAAEVATDCPLTAQTSTTIEKKEKELVAVVRFTSTSEGSSGPSIIHRKGISIRFQGSGPLCPVTSVRNPRGRDLGVNVKSRSVTTRASKADKAVASFELF